MPKLTAITIKRIAAPLLLLALLVGAGRCEARSGFWSAKGESPRMTGEQAKWWAPGGFAHVDYLPYKVYLTMGRSVIDLGNIFLSPDLAEVAWSVEAKGTFMNATDGGWTGSWQTRAFVASEGGAREIPVLDLVAKANALQSSCEKLNVMSVGWIESGKALLVIEQVPNSSGCSDMNKAVLFVIDVQQDRIRETLTPSQARKAYSNSFGSGTKAILTQSPNRSP
jgi:hypothetical protein